MKARFTEKQPAVLWQELPDGKVDVTICLNEKEVQEEYETSTAQGPGGNESTSGGKEEKTVQTLWEYDFNQFREKTENISKDEIERNPEKYLEYVPVPETSGDDLEKRVNEMAEDLNGLKNAIERGLTI